MFCRDKERKRYLSFCLPRLCERGSHNPVLRTELKLGSVRYMLRWLPSLELRAETHVGCSFMSCVIWKEKRA
jgi:hypothetical protein